MDFDLVLMITPEGYGVWVKPVTSSTELEKRRNKVNADEELHSAVPHCSLDVPWSERNRDNISIERWFAEDIAH